MIKITNHERSRQIKQFKVEYLLVIIFFFPTINLYTSRIMTAFNFSTLSQQFYVLFFSIATYSYLFVIKRKIILSTSVILVFIFIFLTSIVINPFIVEYMFNNTFLRSNFILFWAFSLPLLLLTLLPINHDLLSKLLYRISWFLVLMFILMTVIEYFYDKRAFIYYMSTSYSILFPIAFLFYKLNLKSKKFLMIFPAFALIIVLFGGARGASVTILAFIVLSNLFNKKTGNGLLSIIRNLFTLLILTIFLIEFDSVVKVLNQMIESLGVNSRVINSVLQGNFLESLGRTEIWLTLIEKISIFGYGLYGDWVLVRVYSHNILLELVIQFGLVFGILISFLLLFLSIFSGISAFKNRNTFHKFLVLYWFSIIMIKHMISASYLSSPEFWLILGLQINIMLYRKYNLKNNFGLKE